MERGKIGINVEVGSDFFIFMDGKRGVRWKRICFIFILGILEHFHIEWT